MRRAGWSGLGSGKGVVGAWGAGQGVCVCVCVRVCVDLPPATSAFFSGPLVAALAVFLSAAVAVLGWAL